MKADEFIAVAAMFMVIMNFYYALRAFFEIS